jgi:hypothetical protein
MPTNEPQSLVAGMKIGMVIAAGSLLDRCYWESAMKAGLTVWSFSFM